MSTSTAYAQDTLASTAAHAATLAAGRLLALQDSEGYWCADLTADTTLESDYILVQLWLHPPEAGVWNPPTRALVDKAVESILARQLPDGGFNIYAKGPSEISATVKAYFALKVAGLDLDDPRLARAREAHSGTRRPSGGQQLRQDQSQPVRHVSAAILPLHPAGGHVSAGQFHLPDVGLDARHCGLAGYRALQQPARARCPPGSIWMNFTSPASASPSSPAIATSRGAISFWLPTVF